LSTHCKLRPDQTSACLAVAADPHSAINPEIFIAACNGAHPTYFLKTFLMLPSDKLKACSVDSQYFDHFSLTTNGLAMS
jgi:hypothetical protein